MSCTNVCKLITNVLHLSQNWPLTKKDARANKVFNLFRQPLVASGTSKNQPTNKISSELNTGFGLGATCFHSGKYGIELVLQ